MPDERLKKLKAIKEEQQKKVKPFKTTSTAEKWELVEAMAKMLGLIK